LRIDQGPSASQQQRYGAMKGFPMTASVQSARAVASVVASERVTEGGGFIVRRPFPTHRLSDIDPFLMLDEMGPVTYGPNEAIGAPDHPHRGFETVSYILRGSMVHKDSRGHTGRLESGDVQWMTAGAGVVHSEMPSEDFHREGGRLHGFQVWVNLPRKDKLITPRYQDVPADQIPQATTEDGLVTARVVAGEALGVSAVVQTRTPILYAHFTVKPGGQVVQPIPEGYNVFAYVFDGAGQFGPSNRGAQSGDLVRFAAQGDSVTFSVPEAAPQPMELLLLGGVPLREPVARYGPFVMNTRDELMQAFDDYQSGRMGSIDF
jgi:redox-sensitive bicupin YhaK (pirin superfamily)